MIVERRELMLNNLIGFTRIEREDNWREGFSIFKGLDFGGMFYQTGPLVMSIEDVVDKPQFMKFEYFMPLNMDIKLSDGSSDFSHIRTFVIKDALTARFAENEDNIYMYERRLRKENEDNIQLKLEKKSFFLISQLNNEDVVDVYIPVELGE